MDIREPYEQTSLTRGDETLAPRASRPGLRAKILGFAILLAVVPVLVASLSMISETQDELKGSVNDSLLTTVARLTDQVHAVVHPSIQILRMLRTVMEDETTSAQAKSALLASAIQSLDTVEAIQLAPASGESSYLLEGGFKARLDALGLTPAQALQSSAQPRPGKEVVLDMPFELLQSGLWLLPIALSVSPGGAEQPLVMIGYLDVTPLHDLLMQHRFGPAGALWVTTRAGEPLFGPSDRAMAPELSALLTQAQSSGSASVLVTPFQDPHGQAMVGAVGVIEVPPWSLVATLPSQQAYAVVARLLEHLGLWLVVGMAVAVLGALVLAHRLSKPIREMAQLTDQVGAGNFAVRLRETKRRDEIAILGRRLNQMIEGLAESHRRLDRQAHRDFLTGLPNRRFMLKHLESLVADSDMRRAGIALLFIDLDRFKAVNDSLGHAVGDQLLIMAARRLVDCVGGGTEVARLGGDEFLVVLQGHRDQQAIAAVATDLIRAMSEPFHLMEYELYVGGTIGISIVPYEGAEVAELLDMSDMAMYWGKEQGRGHFQFFSGELKRRAVRKLALDSQLRKALDRDELEIYYQPQVDLSSGRIVATEALIRWPDRRGGFVASPGEFIPLAEETGLIVPVGSWVMEAVCRQVRAWQLAGLPELAVSVNVSATQFRRQDFLERVSSSLEQSGLHGQHLGLELTEGVLLEDTRRAIRLMSTLKEMGMQMMIDDFGTGYSSLAYLRRFPLDYVKVAQEFVMSLDTNPHDAMIVGAVIALAKSLGLKIIAEGVETGEQMDFLRDKECDLIQGFYLGRPLRASQLEALLSRESGLQVLAKPVRYSDGMI